MQQPEPLRRPHPHRGAGPARLAVALASAAVVAACEPTNQGYAPDQPVVYSHAVHAGSLKIPCLYCHAAAERSRFAGIPPAQVCLNCHSQVQKEHPEVLKVKKAVETGTPIRWVRVHRLPDFVTFHHGAHVTRGVACQTCHGPVETMGRVEQFAPLTMGWCLDCHRRSWPAAKEREAVALLNAPPRGPDGLPYPPGEAPATRANRLTDCAVCHH